MKLGKRPKTIIVLLFIYTYLFVRGIESLLLFTSSFDYQVFSQAGVSYLYFVLSIPILVITGITLQSLWKPKPIGLWIALIGLALGVLSTIVLFMITFNDPEITKQAYILSREARGLPVRPQNADRMFSMAGISTVFGSALGLYLLLAALFLWKRDYFLQEEKAPPF